MPVAPLRPDSRGVVLSLKAAPSSGKAALSQRRDGTLVLQLKSPPEKGKANTEAQTFLSRLFGAPAALVSGASSRRKGFLIQGMDIQRANAIINKALARRKK